MSAGQIVGIVQVIACIVIGIVALVASTFIGEGE